jgi:hypothetical protein
MNELGGKGTRREKKIREENKMIEINENKVERHETNWLSEW